ncbi:hypothetical protein J6590_095459 [Homalodisca vitripennis]|nr:hypothetical protein J6590_095459 [Homalodisca vitripennis]
MSGPVSHMVRLVPTPPPHTDRSTPHPQQLQPVRYPLLSPTKQILVPPKQDLAKCHQGFVKEAAVTADKGIHFNHPNCYSQISKCDTASYTLSSHGNRLRGLVPEPGIDARGCCSSALNHPLLVGTLASPAV